jgi:hypothetical protein
MFVVQDLHIHWYLTRLRKNDANEVKETKQNTKLNKRTVQYQTKNIIL